MGALVAATESQRGLPHVARHGVPPPRRSHGFGGFFGPRSNLSAPLSDTTSQLWAQQPVDHFNAQDNRTFQQQYWTNTVFWKGGNSPVFLYIFGEQAADSGWMEGGTWYLAAQAAGALMVGVEHRYFGSSQPFSDVSLASLQFLTTEQALADLASIHSIVSSAYSLTAANPWVSFGGSYAGALSAWLRQKYPTLFVGAVASSAPVQATYDFQGYMEVLTASLGTSSVGSQCTSAVQSAVQTVQGMTTSTSGLAQLAQLFTLCAGSQPSSALDIAQFMLVVVGAFMRVVQYNNEEGYNIDEVCTMMLNASSPLQGFADVSYLVNVEGNSVQCMETSYSNLIYYLQLDTLTAPYTVSGTRQWTYLLCSELAYFYTTDAPNQIFGNLVGLDLFVQECTDVFGPNFNAASIQASVNATNAYYGGADEVGCQSTVFPNGDLDPWHAASVVPPNSLPPSCSLVYIQGTAHCADMMGPYQGEPPSLTAARDQILATVAKWVA